MAHFNQSAKFTCVWLLIEFPYQPLEACSGVTVPIKFQMLAICIFFLQLVSLAAFVGFIFQRTNSLFCGFFLCYFFASFFSLLISVLYYFLISISSGLIFLFLLWTLEVEPRIIDSRFFLFADVCIPCYEFPSRHCFICVSRNLIWHIFILIQPHVFSFFNFPWDFLFDPWII